MANFMQENVVKYACSCGNLNPIHKLFFCRHCLKLRCGFCVCHEVDSHFCSNCLENIPSTEARCKKNCCTACFDCPSCQHSLSPRATTVVVPRKSDDSPKEGEQEKEITKRMYYLSCLKCRWTSRDVGIPHQAVATGAWPDSGCGFQTHFNKLLEYYQAVVLQDKQEKQEYLRRKAPKVHKFPSLTDRTGLTVSMIRRQIGWADKNTQKAKPVEIEPSLAVEEVDELPENIFTQKVNLHNVTTIKQRHGQPADQPFTVNKLYPQRRFLWIKRSLRCRQCEHNVIKPEYHPTSVKYRIQLFANYHVPEVLLMRCENPLKAGEHCTLLLKLTNPTMHEMTISIKDLPSREQEQEMIEEFKRACSVRETQGTGMLTGSSSVVDTLKSLASTPVSATLATTNLSRQVSLIEEPRFVRQTVNAALQPLEVPFVLSQRDDSTEFDEDVQMQREEPSFITWRKSNKVCVRMVCTPQADLQMGEDVYIGFTLQYNYVNTVTNTAEKKDPVLNELSSRVYVKLGKISTK